jgi:hypothetical protein
MIPARFVPNPHPPAIRKTQSDTDSLSETDYSSSEELPPNPFSPDVTTRYEPKRQGMKRAAFCKEFGLRKTTQSQNHRIAEFGLRAAIEHHKRRQIQKAQSAARMTPAELEVIAAIPTIVERRAARTAHRQARRVAGTRTTPQPETETANEPADAPPGLNVLDMMEVDADDDDPGMDAEEHGADAPEGDE